MEISNLKIFKLDYSGSFSEVSTENAQILDFFTLIDILAVYIPIQKRMYIWVGKNTTQSLRHYIPGLRMRFSEKLPELKILRNITIESGSEPSDFFKFLNINWDQLNSHIKEQEVKLEPIIREIASLKRKLREMVEKENFDEGIKISEKIIELSKEINDAALEREQQDFIKELQDKSKIKASVGNIEEEAQKIRNYYNNLIKTNKPEDIVKAHFIVEDFKKTYQESVDLTSVPISSELISRDKNIWFTFSQEQKSITKELLLLNDQLKNAMDKYEVSNVENTMNKAKSLILRVVDDELKKEWSGIEDNYVEWKLKNVTIAKIEESLKESTILKENFQFEDAILELDSTMDLIQDKEILEYSKKLKEKRDEIRKAEEEYIKTREKIAVLDERIRESRKNNLLNAALKNCEILIQFAESIKKHDTILTFNQILEEIKEELEKANAKKQDEQLELLKQSKELENIIEVDQQNVLPLVEAFPVNEIIGNLSGDANEMLNQISNLLIEHRVNVKNDISNKALITSSTGDVLELEKNIEVQKLGDKDEIAKFNVQSGVVNPFDDAIESAIITDLIPYNFEIMEMQLNGEPVKTLPDKLLTKNGVEFRWELENIPPKEKVEINYDLRRRISRSIIFILEGKLQIIKTHSNLQNLELEGFYEASLPFSNSYGTTIEGVIIEDIIPLYYLHFVKEPTHIIPTVTSNTEHGDLIKWNIGTMRCESLNYHYRLLELYRLEELKINIKDLTKNGISAINEGDLTEALQIYDNLINQLEEYNR